MNLDTLIQQLRSIRDTGDQSDDEITEKVGCAIAYAAGWGGEPILKCLAAALTDANFHTESDAVGAMLAKLEADECGD